MLAPEGLFQGSPAAEVAVHLALPVLPQAAEVLIQRGRLFQGGSGQRLGRLTGAEARHQLHVLEHLLGDVELAQGERFQLPPRGQREGQPQRPLRQRVGQAFVDRDGEAGRARDRGDLVDDVVDPLRAGVDEVEGPAVEARLVGDVLERAGHPVDRHDVRVAEVGPHQRHPLWEQVAQALDRLEEVVGTVDLVHLAGPRVAHHDRRAIRAPGHVGLFAHDPLGLELGAVVGRWQPLALVEHLLGEDAVVGTGDGDRGHVVQALGVDRAGQFDRVRGAAHVDRRVALRRRGEVVDGRQVEHVVDLPPQLRHLLLLDPEQGTAQVPDHRLDAVAGGRADEHRPALDEVLQAAPGALPHEHVDLALAVFEQALDQVPADEARSASDEVRHLVREPTA